VSSLAEATVVYTFVVGLVCLVLAVSGRPRPSVVDAALVLVAVAAVGVAAIGVVGVLRGRHYAELGTHLGYLFTTPLIIPAAAGSFQGDRGRWSNAGMATGCLVLVVVLVRAVATSHG
jgi:hypothetical protein